MAAARAAEPAAADPAELSPTEIADEEVIGDDEADPNATQVEEEDEADPNATQVEEEDEAEAAPPAEAVPPPPPPPPPPPLPPPTDAEIEQFFAANEVAWNDDEQTALQGTARTDVDVLWRFLDRMGVDYATLLVPDRFYRRRRARRLPLAACARARAAPWCGVVLVRAARAPGGGRARRVDRRRRPAVRRERERCCERELLA